jgi:hypothetical protein
MIYVGKSIHDMTGTIQLFLSVHSVCRSTHTGKRLGPKYYLSTFDDIT